MKSRFFFETDPVEAEIVRRDGAVGLLADDRIALLGAQHVHRLGAVRRDAELAPAAGIASHSSRPRRPSTFTSYASSPEKLMRQTRAGMPATSPSAIAMNGKRLVVERDRGQPREQRRASPARRPRPSPTAR